MSLQEPMSEDEGQESLHQEFKSGEKEPARQVGDVTAMSSDGRGIVKCRDQIFFAEGVVTGDRVAFTPDLMAKPAVAKNAKVLKLSKDRCEHPCRHAAECPASEWGIASYELQLQEKTGLVRRILRGVVEAEGVSEIWPSPQQWGYRNRLTLQVKQRERGGADLGYSIGARDAGFAPIRNCLLGTKTIGKAVAHVGWIMRDARELPLETFPDRLTFYETEAGAGLMAIYKGQPEETDVQQFLEFAESFELPGEMWAASANKAGVVGDRGMVWRAKESLSMQVGWLGHSLEVHPAGFAQVNEGAADLVLRYLREQRERFSAKTIWDLYGGYGALGFAVAGGESRVEVVEQNGLSESTFEQLQEINPHTDAKFQRGEVARQLPKVCENFGPHDLVILDPPRSGCHPEVLEQLCDSPLGRIIYMSCNPARLSRDLKLLAPSGFKATTIQPVDFFPQTPEIEVIAVLER